MCVQRCSRCLIACVNTRRGLRPLPVRVSLSRPQPLPPPASSAALGPLFAGRSRLSEQTAAPLASSFLQACFRTFMPYALCFAHPALFISTGLLYASLQW